MFTCCLRGRQASSLCGVRAGGCPEVGLEGWLRWLAQSLLNHFSRVQLYVTPWTVAHQTPPSMEFSRQEYWSGWPFPPPGGLPDPGLRCCCVQGACTVPCFCSQPPAFAPGASEWLLGFLVSLCLLSRICPSCACVQFLFVPYSLFVFCCVRRDMRRAVFRCKRCSPATKGPESQPVSLL